MRWYCGEPIEDDSVSYTSSSDDEIDYDDECFGMTPTHVQTQIYVWENKTDKH